MNIEEFDGYAYAYRAWPGSDPAGVAARFNELTAYVESLIESEIEEFFQYANVQQEMPCTIDISPPSPQEL